MEELKAQGEELKAQEVEFNEQDSLLVIKKMIQVSRRRMENNGILFIIWGWIMFIVYLMDYLERQIVLTYNLNMTLRYTESALMILAILLTIYIVFIKKKKVKSYINDSLKIVWFSMAASLVLTNIIILNQEKIVDASLQNPIFMLIIAMAIVISGGILRYRLLIVGGIIFGIAAFLCSYLEVENQLIAESIAYLLAFVIPGHVMYSKRKNQKHVQES